MYGRERVGRSEESRWISSASSLIACGRALSVHRAGGGEECVCTGRVREHSAEGERRTTRPCVREFSLNLASIHRDISIRLNLGAKKEGGSPNLVVEFGLSYEALRRVFAEQKAATHTHTHTHTHIVSHVRRVCISGTAAEATAVRALIAATRT
eukprot:2850280-Rhodomonas_salina.1